MVARPESVPGGDIVVEDAAVVDDPGDHAHARGRCRAQGELARPRLERVEDQHRPIDQRPEPLEAVDQIQREAVRRAGRDAEQPREALLAQRRHPLPDRFAGVTDAVRVVQQQHVEAVEPAALQAALRRHPQIVPVVVWSAQRRVGEAREALRAGPLARVEVVADGPDDADALARDALEGHAEQAIGLAGPIHVGRDHRVDLGVRSKQRDQALLFERLPEMHEAPAAPGSQRGDPRIAVLRPVHPIQSRCAPAWPPLGSRAVPRVRFQRSACPVERTAGGAG